MKDKGTTLSTENILGMATTERDVKILLDIDRVLTSEECIRLDKAA
jgi:hypothetical protein